MRTTAPIVAVAAVLTLLAPTAGAQQPAAEGGTGRDNATASVSHPAATEIDVIPAEQAAQQQALSVGRLFSTTVIDRKGERVGVVTDVVVGPDNRALGIIVEAPGGLALGQSRFRVRWNELEDAGPEGIRIPVAADDVDGISPFGGSPPPGAATEPLPQDAWVISQVLGDRIEAADGRSEGRVVDVLLAKDGQIAALVMGSPSPSPLGDAGPAQAPAR